MTMSAIQEEHPELSLLKTERIWPHKQRGEGHFVAVLMKHGETNIDSRPAASGRQTNASGRRKSSPSSSALQEALRLFQAFAADHLQSWELPAREPLLFGDQLYLLPKGREGVFASPLLEGLRTLRPGLHLGTVKKNRFEPAHALALSLQPGQARHVVTLDPDSPQAEAYLRGETLAVDPALASGWTLTAFGSCSAGWGKQSGGQLKNHYPKGLRRLS